MTPSQRTILFSVALGAVGFVVLFALGIAWALAAGLGVLLAVFGWLALNYMTPTDKQTELERNLRHIDRATAVIRTLSHRVADERTQASLQAGCDAVPRMVEIIRGRDAGIALSLSQRSLTYILDVADTLRTYVDVQDGGDPEYLRLGQQELQRFESFTTQPDKNLSAQKMDDYINSLTALNLNPPPELT